MCMFADWGDDPIPVDLSYYQEPEADKDTLRTIDTALLYAVENILSSVFIPSWRRSTTAGGM